MIEGSNNSISLISAYDKGYRVTNEGEVYYKDRQRKLYIDNTGYYSFTIRNGSKINNIQVHKLVAYQKYKYLLFDNKSHIRHLNGNPLDNRIDNIKIGSASDNMMDISKELRILHASNPKYKHDLILEDYNKGLSYLKLMEKYNISSKGTISYIIKKSLKSKNIL